MKHEETLSSSGLEVANPHGVPGAALLPGTGALIAHTEDVGLAFMTRELVAVSDGKGNKVWGLRETVSPK
jgi:hypothetical protein